MRPIIGFINGSLLWLLLRCVLLFTNLPPSKRGRRSGNAAPGLRVLVTGRVDSKNWCMSHLLPLARTANISELILVMDGKVVQLPRSRHVRVPAWIGWFRPRAIARSFWAIIVAIREKPDVVMAYSLFPPGLFGLVGARLTGAAAVVQLAGGKHEMESGGWENENIRMPKFLVRRLVPLCHRVCGRFETVVVRGRNTEDYVRQHCSPGRIQIIPGSIDPARFLENRPRDIDIAFVGRIVGVKQPDHVIEVVRRLVARRPGLRVVVAGRGEMLDEMKAAAERAGVSRNIRFAGHVEKVEGLLRRSRIFLLTSRSEGLSIALAEAMTAGAVPVVADVGDLGQLVVNNKTGWLVKPGDFNGYEEKIHSLLENEASWRQLSANAREAALENNGVDAVARRWEECLNKLAPVDDSGPRPAPETSQNHCLMK